MASNTSADGKLLNNWKEIALYLGRGVRTVQRWEADLQLPVRRPRGKGRSAVIALKTELDEWLAKTPARALDSGDKGFEHQNRLTKMCVLVVEDSVTDLNNCVAILKKLGVAEINVDSNVPAALLRLQQIHAGNLPLPDLIVLDLALQSESGFEVLRYCRARPKLKSIRIIVWTAMGKNSSELRDVFHVQSVVSKWAGARELEFALRATSPDSADSLVA